jgi:hypothetical protein
MVVRSLSRRFVTLALAAVGLASTATVASTAEADPNNGKAGR